MQRESHGEELNLQRLYQELLPTVYRAAYSCLKNPSDSEDAAQEAFLRLARYKERFESERQIRSWLVVTVTNISRDMLRSRHRKDLPLDECPELATPETRSGEVLSAVLELSAPFQTAVFLYYYEGYSVKEIARAMKTTEGTIKSWLHRARKQLRRSLGEDQ